MVVGNVGAELVDLFVHLYVSLDGLRRSVMSGEAGKFQVDVAKVRVDLVVFFVHLYV